MKTSVILLYLCLLCGCSEPLSLSDDPAVATRQIEKLFPIGTPKEKAKKFLTDCGIRYQEQDGDFGAEKIGKYIYIDYSKSKNFVTARWQIALILESECVSKYRVNFGLIGP